MLQILNNLGPLFLVILLGAVLARHGWLTDGFTKPLNRVIYWIALPSLVVLSLARAQFDALAALKVYGIFMAGTAGSMVLALFIALLLRLPTPSAAAFVQAAFRGNLAIIGLPVLTYHMAQKGAGLAETDSLPATGALVLGATMITYNVLSVLVLLPCQKRHEPGVEPERPHALQQIVTNPLIVASVLGAVLGGFSVPVPQVLLGTLGALADLAIPGALLCIGAGLGTTRLRGRILWPSLASLVKVAATPVFTLVVAANLGLHGPELMLAMLFSACPTAAASYILAERMGADAHLAGSAIALSTLFSALPLTLVLTLFG
jgi:predicted permease